MPLHNPNSEIVATAFIRTLVPGVSVGTTLPKDTNSWMEGFVQVQVVGGNPGLYTPTRQPLVQVDCWVPSVTTDKPQWGRANTLAENIVNATYVYDDSPKTTLTFANNKPAIVYSMVVATEVRRVPGDPLGYARYTFDAVLNWATVNDAV